MILEDQDGWDSPQSKVGPEVGSEPILFSRLLFDKISCYQGKYSLSIIGQFYPKLALFGYFRQFIE